MDDIVMAFLGGLFIGLAVIGYLYVHGRIAGISGLMAQVFLPNTTTIKSRMNNPALWFLLGLFVIPFIYAQFFSPTIVFNASPVALMVAGLLVGIGTRLGSGCTSGHGICGISRLSVRSMMATGMFMLTGFMTVYMIRHILRW